MNTVNIIHELFALHYINLMLIRLITFSQFGFCFQVSKVLCTPEDAP